MDSEKTNNKVWLWPAAMLFGLAIWLRHKFFDWGWLKSKSYHTLSFVVGNITVGGTGKTPHIEYLINLLSDYRVATLSRGYRRKTKGFVLAETNSTVDTIGDEPKQIKSKFSNIIVAVDENRCHGMETLEQISPKPELVLLDDAFQHRYFIPTVNIVLSDYYRPFFKDHILPVGQLRDLKSQIKRADIVIVSKTPSDIAPIKKRIIQKELKLFPYQKLFFTTQVYGDLVPLNPQLKFEYNASFHVLMLTGIASPFTMEQYLQKQYSGLTALNFPDHHNFSDEDLKKVVSSYENLKFAQKIVVTTHKDAVRLLDNSNFALISEIPIFYLPIELGFLSPNEQEEFNETILKYAKKIRRHH